MLHSPPGIPVDIGPGATDRARCASSTAPTSVSRGADRQPFATVLDGAVIGAAQPGRGRHSLVTGGTKIPDEVFVTGAPAKVRGPIAGTGAEMWVNVNPGAYQDLARRYIDGLALIAE